MHDFTPASALTGGILIGLATLLLFATTGRLAGISSIASKLLAWRENDTLWRVTFLFGLIAGVAVFYSVAGNAPVSRPHFPAWLLAAAGLLVGFGTSLANGCTSGHGVCGLARLSVRSLAATLTFLVTGIVATYVVRHLFGVQ